MKEYVFDCKGNNAPAYGCCRPGDNSGVYVKKDDVKELKAQVHTMAMKIQGQAVTLMAVHSLEFHDKNFLCGDKNRTIMKKEHLTEIVRLTNNLDEI